MASSNYTLFLLPTNSWLQAELIPVEDGALLSPTKTTPVPRPIQAIIPLVAGIIQLG
jgi:hypothetical protein